MRRTIVGIVIGLVLGWALFGRAPVQAQPGYNPTRLYGTTSTGKPIPLSASTSGILTVSCQ